MKAHAKEQGAPDLILFTGDLSYQGKPDELECVTNTLNEIRAAVGGDPIVVPVPGNHDLAWPGTPHGTFRHYLRDDELRKGFLNAPERHLLAYLEERFEAYLTWWKREITSDWDCRKLKWEPGLLPGDFCLTVEVAGLRLGLLGINSAWLQLQPGMKARELAVEVEQLANANIEIPRWAKAHDAALLLMHHPPEWLEEKREQDFRTYIYAPDRFVACLFGHMHEHQSRLEGTGAGPQRIWLQASSLFGLEHYGETHKESRVCGYDWGQLERLAPDRGMLTRWKRRADRADGNVIVVEKPFGAQEREEFPVALRPAMPSPDRVGAISIPSPKAAWKGAALTAEQRNLNEAQQMFANGRLYEALEQTRTLAARLERMDETGRDESHAHFLARARLLEATCHLCLQDSQAARRCVDAIQGNLLDEDQRPRLAEVLAQVGEIARARAVLQDLDSAAAEDARQLIAVEEGEIPESLTEAPAVRMRAAMRSIEQGEHDRAARWALAVHERTPDQALTTAAVIECLLTALEWSAIYVPATCTPVAEDLRPQIIRFLQEHLEPRQFSPLAPAVPEKRRALWSARFHLLSQDVVRLEMARTWLRELGEDDRGFAPLLPEDDAEIAPVSAPPWLDEYRQAARLAMKNQLEAALDILRAAIARYPDRMPLLREAALVCENKGELAQALAYAQESFRLFPGHGQAIVLGRLRLANGQAQAVWDDLRAHLQGSPDVWARRLLAQAAMLVALAEAPERWRDVLALAEHATALDRIGLASSLHLLHSPQEAAEQAWQAFEQDGADLTSEALARCALLQLQIEDPNTPDRVAQIGKALGARCEAYDDPDAYRWYLRLQRRLGSSALLPDLERPEQEGEHMPLSGDHALTLLRIQNGQQQAMLDLYFGGELSVESLTSIIGTQEAALVAWLIRSGRPLITPLDIRGGCDDIAGKQVLLGALDLLVLDDLDLLPAFDRALGKRGRVVLFADVAHRLYDAPTAFRLREQPQDLDRLLAVRAYVQEHALSASSDTEQDEASWCRAQEAVLVRAQPRDGDELALETLVRALLSQGHLDRSHAEQACAHLQLYQPPESSLPALPERIAVDGAALALLGEYSLLEDVCAAFPQMCLVTPHAWAEIEADIIRHELLRDARKRAERVHAWLADMERRDRIISRLERPHVDLPLVRNPDQDVARWIEQAASWGEALAQHADLWLLSADAMAAELFVSSIPVRLLGTLQWSEERYRSHTQRVRASAVQKRKVSFAALARRLAGDRKSETIKRLQALGFANAYGEDEIIDLAGGAGGLSGPRAARILDGIEARSRNTAMVGWEVARHGVARLYAETIWKAWCERETPHARDITGTLLDRIAHIDPEEPESLLQTGFQYLWELAVNDYAASFCPEEHEPRAMTLSTESRAGHLWGCIDAWLGENTHRRHLLVHTATDVLIAIDERRLAESNILRVSPFLVAAQVFESTLGGSLETLSGLWDEHPLDRMVGPIHRGEHVTRSISLEEILRLAAQQLANVAQTIEDDGLGWTVPIEIDGMTFGVEGLRPAALLLRCRADVRTELASYLAAREGPDDGRVLAPLIAIAAEPNDRNALRAYAQLAAEAPWHRIRLDPWAVRLWRTSSQSFPATIDDLRALLSEPGPLPDEGTIENILFARLNDDGVWRDRPDRIELLDRCGWILGHPDWPIAWRFSPESDLTALCKKALDRLMRPWEQPAARLAFDLLHCCILGSIEEDAELRQRISTILADVLSAAVAPPPPDSLAAHEPALLRTAAHVVQRMGGGRESMRNRLWLTWCLHQWVLRQVDSLPPDRQPELLHGLVSAWPVIELSEEADLLDPSRFGHGRLDHRLVAILHVLVGLPSATLQPLATAKLEEMLEVLAGRSPTLEEHAVEDLPAPPSCLDWPDGLPRIVPALAAEALASLRTPAEPEAIQNESKSST